MRASILGLTILLASAAPALADDKAKAKALYEQGLKAYNIAEYADAIKAWKQAYSLTKKSLLLFNIGQAYRLDGDCKKAMTFYDTYQREEPNPKNPDELDSAVALCVKALEKADKPKPIDTPADKPKPLDKPPVADKPVADKPVVAQIDLPEEPVDDPEEESSSSGGGLRKIGIGVGAAGVVLGGVAIYFALDSGSAASELDNFMGAWGPTQVDLEASGKRSAKLGWITGGIGIAAIAAGSVMFAIGGPKATETSSVAVVPTLGGAAFSWSSKF